MRTLLLMTACMMAGCANSNEQASQRAGDATSGATASAPQNAATPPAARFDPLAGAYPSIMWMANIMEVDRRVIINDEGLLRVDDSPGKPTPSARVITKDEERRFFESARVTPGWRQVSSPVIMSRPASDARIEIGARDKPGSRSTDIGVQVHGVISGDDVITNAAVYFHPRAGETTTHSFDGAVIPNRGGLVMIDSIGEPDANGAFNRWSVVFIRPTILRSADDYPFQTASSFSGPPSK